MSALRLTGPTLVIAPIQAQASVGGILLPGRHYAHEPQQWRVLQVGCGRKAKRTGLALPLEIAPGDVIITPTFFEALHEFSDGVRIVEAGIALAVVEGQ